MCPRQLLLFPLERLKTLLQVNPDAAPGLLELLQRVLRDEGGHVEHTC